VLLLAAGMLLRTDHEATGGAKRIGGVDKQERGGPRRTIRDDGRIFGRVTRLGFRPGAIARADGAVDGGWSSPLGSAKIEDRDLSPLALWALG